MTARAAAWIALAVASGCVSEHPIDLELRLPEPADAGVAAVEPTSYELRLYRLEDDEGCPTASVAASATEFAELGHAQAFAAAEGMGEAIGEVPRGRYAVAALARDDECVVRLYGCTEVHVGVAAPDTLVVELEPQEAELGCGACRSCEEGVCEPVDAICP